MAKKRVRRASAEFDGANLGDERLTKRLAKIADALAASPASSFPKATADESELEAVYRFMSNARVSPRGILAPHFAASARRAGRGDVIVAHDTTNFVFRGITKREGLGRFKNGVAQGFFGHFALAIAADGSKQPFGLVGLRTIVRQTVHGTVTPPGTSPEFARWAGLALDVHEMLPRAIHVMDREGDSVTVFNDLAAAGARFVIRCNHNRRLAKDDESGERLLFDALERGETMLKRSVPLSRRDPDPIGRALRKTYPPRTARMAKLRVKASRVTMKSPPYGHVAPDWPRTVTLNALLVEEVSPKKDVAPVCWRLFTNLPVDTPEQVAFAVDAYCARWVIEEFFKAIKTGCAFERRQLETCRALLNALAMFSVIAWRLLLLRHTARTSPDAPALAVLTSQQVRVLKKLAVMEGPNVPKVVMPAEPTANDALLAVAQLGGHLKSNGPPGWQVLGRGYDSLLLVELGWMARGRRM
jgi:hypothetical protein